MADRADTAVGDDFFIGKTAPFPDEIGCTVCQQADKLRFQTAFGKFRKDVVLRGGFQRLQIPVVIFGNRLRGKAENQFGKLRCLIAVRIGKAFCYLRPHTLVKLPVGHGDGSAVGLRKVEQVGNCQFGVFVFADGDAFLILIDVSADIIPLLGGCECGDIWVLCIHKQNIIKTVLVKVGGKVEIIPPVALGARDVRRNGFVYGL